MTSEPSILIFPAGMPRALDFLATCLRDSCRVIGASSLAYDPTRPKYTSWLTLPYINEDGFDAALSRAVAEHKVGSIYSSHPVVWDYLSRTLAHIAPGVQLLNTSPVNVELDPYRAAKINAHALLNAPLSLAVAQPPAPDMTALELTAFLLHADKIPGMCDNEKLRALYEIARYCPQGDVVEIGSWWGKSAFIFLHLAQHYGIGKVLCVDPWSDAHLVQDDKNGLVDMASAQLSAEEALSVFEINLLPYSQGDMNYLRMPSTAGADQYRRTTDVQTPAFGKTSYTGRIALLHVDGNHSYDNVKADVEAWSGLVLPGGWMVIDDYTWPFGDGPQRVGNAYLSASAGRISTAFVTGGALFIRTSAEGE